MDKYKLLNGGDLAFIGDAYLDFGECHSLI